MVVISTCLAPGCNLVVGHHGPHESGRWVVERVDTGSAKPWRAWAPDSVCRIACVCHSFETWAEAMAYVTVGGQQ